VKVRRIKTIILKSPRRIRRNKVKQLMRRKKVMLKMRMKKVAPKKAAELHVLCFELV